MEDRAKYVLIGAFTLAVIAGVFGFIYWLNATSDIKGSAFYRVIFSGPVIGLRVGAPVLFNGIRVGEVSDLRLTDNPAEVAATLAVAPKTPVRADTLVALDYAGLTGIASVSLRGNLSSAPPLLSKNGQPPTLKAEATNGDMSAAVRDTLAKADAVISENQETLHNTLKNLETFSAALARNGENLDKLISTGTDAVASFKELTTNLDTRTASITDGVNTLTAAATKHIDIVGNDAHRAIVHIDKAVTDLADHPQRLLFGGGK